jgi:hypothetical protein
MSSKPVTPVTPPPDRTETIKILISKWEKKNNVKELVSTPVKNQDKPVTGKENKTG